MYIPHCDLEMLKEMVGDLRIGESPDRISTILQALLNMHFPTVLSIAKQKGYATENITTLQRTILIVLELELPLAEFLLSLSPGYDPETLQIAETQKKIALLNLERFRFGHFGAAWEYPSLNLEPLIRVQEAVAYVTEFQRKLPTEDSRPKYTVIEKWCLFYSSLGIALAKRRGHWSNGLLEEKRNLYTSWISMLISSLILRMKDLSRDTSLNGQANMLINLANTGIDNIIKRKNNALFIGV